MPKEKVIRLSIRDAKDILENLDPLPLRFNKTDFTGLPSDAKWEKIKATYGKLRRTWFHQPRVETQTRIGKYATQFYARDLRRQEHGISETDGTSADFRNWMAGERQGVEL